MVEPDGAVAVAVAVATVVAVPATWRLRERVMRIVVVAVRWWSYFTKTNTHHTRENEGAG